MRNSIRTFCLLICVVFIASSASAQDLLPRDNGIFTYHHAPDYRESESHPIRTVAWVVHPVGWIAREAFYRPLSAMTASTKFTRSFFGYRGPFDFRRPECFSSDDSAPNCHELLPLNALSTAIVQRPMEGEEMAMSGERQIFIPDVNFEFDKANLNDLGQGRVRQISQLLASVPSLQIVVEGHADYKGSDEYNQALGERRAQIVIKELTELGIDPGRMSPVSMGESKPIFAEETDWARAVNRRVQFSVQGQG